MYFIRGVTSVRMGFPGDPVVRNTPTVQETRVQSLGWEGPLENEMATHSSVLVWGTPWTEEPGGLQPRGPRKSQARLRNQTTTTSQGCVCQPQPSSSPSLLLGVHTFVL